MAKFFVGFIIFAYSPIRNPDMQEVMLTIGWADLKSFLSVGYILFVIVTIAVIIHDKREPVKALSWIIVISLLPVVELRGGIPYGISQGLDPWLAFAASALGNMLPVPFLLLFVRKILHWMKRYPRLGRLAVSLERRADRKSSRVRKSELVGLCILVAIPLPGTGAWTGALVAALMEMRLKRALPAIYAGVLIAGLLVTLALTGVKALRFLA
mgnify:CR=1 FL=1